MSERPSPLEWEAALDDDEPRPPGLPPFVPRLEATPRPRRAGSAGTGSGASGSAAGSLLRELPVLAVAAILVAFVLRTFVFQAFFIPSPSMGCEGCAVETLAIDDKILVSKLAYRMHAPRRGDIVVFDCPEAASCADRPRAANPLSGAFRWFGERVGLVPPSTEDYVKRVIALPGEAVEIHDGLVFVNGQPLVEPYLPPTMQTVVSSTFSQPYIVPPDHLWVMGDNRGNSSDSRVFQAIPIDSVVGRAVAVFWPMPRAGFL